MLRVYVDEAFAQLLEDGERHGGIIDEGTTLASSSDFATHKTFYIVLYFVFFEQSLKTISCNIKSSFDNALAGSATYGGSLGALACKQAYGAEKDGLTGARFTCDNREAFREIKVERLDESVVLYM